MIKSRQRPFMGEIGAIQSLRDFYLIDARICDWCIRVDRGEKSLRLVQGPVQNCLCVDCVGRRWGCRRPVWSMIDQRVGWAMFDAFTG